MPTPSPIITASCRAKSAVSKTWVPRVTRLRPTPSANSAVMIGRPIATTEPKVSSRTTIGGQQADREGDVAFFFRPACLDRLTAQLDLQPVAVGGLGDRR